MQHQRLLSLLQIEISVARTHSQPVRLAHNRTRHNLHRKFQVAHHAANNRHLRRILLPEECRIRLDNMKQFRHHRSHAAKMPGPRTPVQLVTQPFHRNPGHAARRIHLLNRWSEKQLHALFRQQIAVPFEALADISPDPRRARTALDLQRSRPPPHRRQLRAARTRDKCPSCSAPMVGTNPNRLPPRRAARHAARMSSMVLQIFMAWGRRLRK